MLHFAYGSNLSTVRLQARIGSVRKWAVFRLSGYALRFHKHSLDGSAKADAYLTHEDRDAIWGVAWQIDGRQKAILDRYEGLGHGYTERHETVSLHGQSLQLQLYVAMPQAIQPGVKPYDWYRAFVVAGAEEHGLPEEYQQRLRQIETQPDPDPNRARRNWSLLQL